MMLFFRDLHTEESKAAEQCMTGIDEDLGVCVMPDASPQRLQKSPVLLSMVKR